MGVERFGRNLAAGGQDAQRDGQVEAAGLLGQVGRCQVDGDAAVGEFVAAVEDGGAHALAAFAHAGVGQADDGEDRQAVGQVRFHAHRRRGDAGQRAAAQDGKTHVRPSVSSNR
ncbi:hypothetical protein D3C72_2068900 [compost metagenome]